MPWTNSSRRLSSGQPPLADMRRGSSRNLYKESVFSVSLVGGASRVLKVLWFKVTSNNAGSSWFSLVFLVLFVLFLWFSYSSPSSLRQIVELLVQRGAQTGLLDRRDRSRFLTDDVFGFLKVEEAKCRN